MRNSFVSLLAATMVFTAYGQEEPLAIGGISSGQGRVAVTLKGGKGLAQLEEREDVTEGDFAPTSALTTETNIVKGALTPKKFFRARSAPQNDIGILQNTLSMLDQGRHIFRYDTFGDEAF